MIKVMIHNTGSMNISAKNSASLRDLKKLTGWAPGTGANRVSSEHRLRTFEGSI